MTSLRTNFEAPRWWALSLLYAAAMALVALLVAVSTLGPSFGLVALGAAALIGLVATAGTERLGVAAIAGGYFTAPFYKGVAFGASAVVTATDLLLLTGFVLLLPRLVRGRLRLPPVYYAGIGLVLLAGMGGSVFSDKTGESFVNLGFWLIVMVGLPVAIALWGPSGRQVDLLAGSFVAGQCFSLVLGMVLGREAQGRQAGLSTHPNYLAQGGMLALCLLLYLAYRHASRSVLSTVLLLVAGAVCLSSVLMSGSRAGTVVVAVLLLMVPVVERSAFTGFLVAAGAALLVLVLPFLAGAAGEESVLARLGGDTSAQYSNSARSMGLEAGITRFFEHPLRGTGLVDLFEIHNNFVEVAVAIGIFGLAGYLLVLYAFARPLLGTGEHRRLSYVVWGYIGFGATVPSLYDRSVWAVVALSVVAMAMERGRDDGSATTTTSSPVPLRGTLAPGRLAVPGRRSAPTRAPHLS